MLARVVGSALGLYPTYPGTIQGFLYDNGNYTALSYPGAIVMPYGINDTGFIVGQLTLSNATSPGFLLHSNGVYTLLVDPLSLSGDTRAYGINNSGEIVGDYDAGSSGGSPGETPLPASLPLFATGLGALGCLVGESGRTLLPSLPLTKTPERFSD